MYSFAVLVVDAGNSSGFGFDVKAASSPTKNPLNVDTRLLATWYNGTHYVAGLKAKVLFNPTTVANREVVNIISKPRAHRMGLSPFPL